NTGMEPTAQKAPRLMPRPLGWSRPILSNSREPVIRSASIVSECEDSNRVGSFQIDNMKRESSYRQTLRDKRYQRSGLGKTSHEFERRVNSSQKFEAKAFALTLVPDGRLFDLGGRFGFRPKPLHFIKRRVMRSRTSSQGSPADSPD